MWGLPVGLQNAAAFRYVWYSRGLIHPSVITRSCTLPLPRCFFVCLGFFPCAFPTKVRNIILYKSEFWEALATRPRAAYVICTVCFLESVFHGSIAVNHIRDPQTILFWPCWYCWPKQAEMLWLLGLTLWGHRGGLSGWFCPGRGAWLLLCCWWWKSVLLGDTLSCSWCPYWAADVLCSWLCLDLISNLWLFLKSCSRDFIPTHTAPVTPSISWVSKYRTEKIH